MNETNTYNFATCGKTALSSFLGNYNKQKNDEQCDSFEVDFGRSAATSSLQGNTFKCALTKDIQVGDLPPL